MIITQDNNEKFTTTEYQDNNLSKILNLPNMYNMEEIVNIIYKNRNIPTNKVSKMLLESGYFFIDFTEIDETMMWLKRIEIKL